MKGAIELGPRRKLGILEMGTTAQQFEKEQGLGHKTIPLQVERNVFVDAAKGQQ
jgi:hypothetical protein